MRTRRFRREGARRGNPRSREQRGFLVILCNGTPVARLEPVAGAPAASLWEALAAWRSGGPDPALAEALERVGEADRPPENPGGW